MLTIRLARSGAKKRPFYHISVADSRMPRDGRFVERVGYYNPIASGQEIRLQIDVERIDYWISKGAQPSDRVLNLLKQNKETPEQAEKRLAAKETKRQKKLAKKLAEKEPVQERRSCSRRSRRSSSRRGSSRRGSSRRGSSRRSSSRRGSSRRSSSRRGRRSSSRRGSSRRSCSRRGSSRRGCSRRGSSRRV